MEQVTKNVFAETKIRGCNPSFVVTGEGTVFIDTPQWISAILSMREAAEARGPVRYLINTEGHIDHIFGNHWFADVDIIGHEKLDELFWTVAGDLPCYEYSVDIIKRQDKDFLHLMPSEEDYIVARPNIKIGDKMILKTGGLSFEIYHTPGHSTSQLAVLVPEEGVLFTGDTIFSGCQTWLHSAEIGPLLDSLSFLEKLEYEFIVPGHGPVVGKQYIKEQRAFIYEWITAVAKGIEAGWPLDECQKRISFSDRYPVDIGQEEMMEYIQNTNVARCYAYLSLRGTQ